MLAFGTKVRGFKPGRSRRIFQGEKNLSMPSFGREVKPYVPYRRFTACKRSLNVTWKSGIFRQKSSAISRPSSSSFHYKGLWWRHLAVQVGTTTDQGLYNKPSAAVHPGALAAGTVPQYNTIQPNRYVTQLRVRNPRSHGSILEQDQEIFNFSKASGSDLGSTVPFIQWVTGVIFRA